MQLQDGFVHLRAFFTSSKTPLGITRITPNHQHYVLILQINITSLLSIMCKSWCTCSYTKNGVGVQTKTNPTITSRIFKVLHLAGSPNLALNAKFHTKISFPQFSFCLHLSATDVLPIRFLNRFSAGGMWDANFPKLQLYNSPPTILSPQYFLTVIYFRCGLHHSR